MGSVVNFRPGGPAGNARLLRTGISHRCGHADEVAALRAEVAALRAQLEGSRLTALAIVFRRPGQCLPGPWFTREQPPAVHELRRGQAVGPAPRRLAQRREC